MLANEVHFRLLCILFSFFIILLANLLRLAFVFIFYVTLSTMAVLFGLLAEMPVFNFICYCAFVLIIPYIHVIEVSFCMVFYE